MKPSLRERDGPDAVESDRQPNAPHPRLTTNLVGHAEAERTVLGAFQSGRFPHAWIIGGRPGIGKATLAWRIARFLRAHPDLASGQARSASSLAVPPETPAARQIAAMTAPDVVLLRREWNAAARPPRFYTDIRVDEVRRATARFHLSASEGWRIALIDSADDLNASAANALLKMIEEPPPRSLFLLVSHQPGRLLPTIRSRCRHLLLQPLRDAELAAALEGLGQGEAVRRDPALLGSARGSVAEALRLIDRQGSRLVKDVEKLLQGLPALDWREVAGLADRVAPARNETEFETFTETVFRFIDDEVRRRAGEGAARLAPLAEVWEKLAAAQLATDALNLDKRPLVLSLFEQLEAAARAAR